jgi:predicted outer membrane repeat protein
MFKRIFFFGFILGTLLAKPALSDTTYVAGNVFGVWDLAGSPYITTSVINVPAGNSLQIEPGVVVNLNHLFYVYGNISAEGTVTDSICFNTGDNYITVQAQAFNSITFRYCKFPVSSGTWCMKFNSGDITFDRCRINLASTSGARTAIYCQAPGTEITDNYIKVSITGGSSPVATGIAGPTIGVDVIYIINNTIEALVNYSGTSDSYTRCISYINGYIVNNDIFASLTRSGTGNANSTCRAIENSEGFFTDNKVTVYACGHATNFGNVNCLCYCAGKFYRNLLILINLTNNFSVTAINSCNSEFINNTIILSGPSYAVHFCNGSFTNSIIYSTAVNTYGLTSGLIHSYNDIYGCTTPYLGTTPGIGEIQLSPQFGANYTLTINSPCIDTGNPADAIDPDGTFRDMGYSPYLQQTFSPLALSLVPDTITVNQSGYQFLEYLGDDSTVWSATILPSFVDFLSSARLFEWAPTVPNIGDTIITIHGENALGDTTQSFDIYVAPGYVDITSSPDTTAIELVPYAYDVNANGIPAPIFSLTQSPAGMIINSINGLISWTADSTFIDSTVVVIVRADNVYSFDTQQYNLHISANQAPTITNFSPTILDSTCAYQPLSFSISAVEPEGEAMDYSWYVNGVQVGDTNTLNLQLTERGETEVCATVVDIWGHQSEHIWTPYVESSVFTVPGDYPTIQSAINACHAYGDTVLVSPGTYFESLNFHGKRVALYSAQGPVVTLIDGDDNYTAVNFISNEDTLSVINGFTIVHCRALNGAGILIADASPKITNNIIRDNYAVNSGGGIYFSQGHPLIWNNQFISNQAKQFGGAIYFNGTVSFDIIDNVFEHNQIIDSSNTVNPAGSAIYGSCNMTYGNLIGNLFRSNILTTQYSSEGGILCLCPVSANTNQILSDNNFIGNTVECGSTANGGIIFLKWWDAHHNVFYNNQITINNPTTMAIAISLQSAMFSNNTLDCSIFQNYLGVSVKNYGIVINEFYNNIISNTANGYGLWSQITSRGYNDLFSNSAGNYYQTSPAVGDISLNPLYVNPFMLDFHLQNGSPCIDAGNPSFPLDPDSTICDMGAFYFNQMVLPEIEDLLVVANGNNMELHWSPFAFATSYHIYRSSQPYFNIGGLQPYAIVTTPGFIDIGAVVGGKYFYRVTVVMD